MRPRIQFPPIWIYHNVALYAPLKRSQTLSDAKTVKMDVSPRVNRENASGTFSARCMTMHETEWRAVSSVLTSRRAKKRTFLPLIHLPLAQKKRGNKNVNGPNPFRFAPAN